VGIEVASYIADLVVTNPLGSDQRNTSDDHHRLVKTVLKTQFSNFSATAVNCTVTELNLLSGYPTALPEFNVAQDWSATQTFTVPVIGVTAPLGDDSTQFATTEYSDAKMVIGTIDTGTTTPLTFGGIPAGTKKITIMYNALANSTGGVTLRIGDSGGIETSGYICTEATIGSTTGGTVATAYFYISSNNGTIYGSTILTLIDPSNNTWVVNGSAQNTGGVIKVVTGSKSLTGALTQLELTIANRIGGSVNIMYEQ